VREATQLVIAPSTEVSGNFFYYDYVFVVWLFDVVMNWCCSFVWL